MNKIVTFKQFGKDFRSYYKCEEVSIRDEIEAEVVMSDLYDCNLYEFDYDKKVIELYY